MCSDIVRSNTITEPFVSFRINLYNKLEVPASIICLWGQLVQSSLHSYYLIFLLSKSQWLHANWLLEIVSHLCLVIHTPSDISWESASWSRKKKIPVVIQKIHSINNQSCSSLIYYYRHGLISWGLLIFSAMQWTQQPVPLDRDTYNYFCFHADPLKSLIHWE